MDKPYYSENYTPITTFNIVSKVREHILNKYYNDLLKELLQQDLITENDITKFHDKFYEFVINCEM
jgi:hypothetical protein